MYLGSTKYLYMIGSDIRQIKMMIANGIALFGSGISIVVQRWSALHDFFYDNNLTIDWKVIFTFKYKYRVKLHARFPTDYPYLRITNRVNHDTMLHEAS